MQRYTGHVRRFREVFDGDGAKPPTCQFNCRVEMAINLKAAKALGLAVPGARQRT
jgi:hypothetical protein